MIRMLRLYDSYSSKIAGQLRASKGNHFVDYSIHASILLPDQISDISFLKELGISSLKIYMNLGADLNRIHLDLEPGSHRIMDGKVEMTDELLTPIVKVGSSVHSTILVHAEDPMVCSELIREGRGKGIGSLEQWSESRPPSSEAQSIAKVSELGRKMGGSNLYLYILVRPLQSTQYFLKEKKVNQIIIWNHAHITLHILHNLGLLQVRSPLHYGLRVISRACGLP